MLISSSIEFLLIIITDFELFLYIPAGCKLKWPLTGTGEWCRDRLFVACGAQLGGARMTFCGETCPVLASCPWIETYKATGLSMGCMAENCPQIVHGTETVVIAPTAGFQVSEACFRKNSRVTVTEMKGREEKSFASTT